MDWFYVIPVAVIAACVTMLPRLEAAESLLAFRRVAVGSGSLKSSAATEILDQWIDEQRGIERIREAAPPAAEPGPKYIPPKMKVILVPKEGAPSAS